jgi:uncharacterized protein YjbI with pentapeptide repeats
VRQPAPDRSGDNERNESALSLNPPSFKPTTDVQAAMTVLGRLPQRSGVSRGDLSGALLAGAVLGGANLSGAALGGANLSGAFLDEADLSGAFLGEANLSSARLDRANLRKTRSLTQKQLNSADGDAKTQLPDRLQRPDDWASG